MSDPDQTRRFLDEYVEYERSVLRPTYDEMRKVLSRWNDPEDPGYWARYSESSSLPTPSPIQRIRVHIKRPESVVDKVFRKPSDFPERLSLSSLRKMTDAVRARAIVYFMGQLPLVHCEVRRLVEVGTWEISSEFPPTAYLNDDGVKRYGLEGFRVQEKDSGYISLHYILRFRESTVAADSRPWFELQVRTLAEELWGEIEHLLGYKPQKKTNFAVKKQFWILSKQLSAIDEHFNFLHEELNRFQEEVTPKDEDPLNAENLPKVLSEVGLGCAQKEIGGLLKLLNSRHITSAGELRLLATVKRIDVIRNTHLSLTKRLPKHFEMVATLAAIKGARDEAEVTSLIRSQIDFLEAWNKLKG